MGQELILTGAIISEYFFIDHGTGVVGCGDWNHVKLYQGLL